jgi:hypothetical protein
MATGAEETQLVSLSAPNLVAITQTETADVRAHVMAAVAAVWAMGVPAKLIGAGLLRFGEVPNATSVH